MGSRRIDHLVLPVADLARSRGRLSSLGFTVAADAVHPFGTANACVFLEDGTYLEPLAIADRRKATVSAKRGNVFVERDLAFRGRKAREGLSGLVVASDDAAADHDRYAEKGISAGALLEFSRRIVSPDGDEAEGRFRLAFASEGEASDLFAFACQRIVAFPQSLDALVSHANAVTGLKEVVLAQAEPSASTPFWQEVMQVQAEEEEAGLVFAAETARLRIVDMAQQEQEFGPSSLPDGVRGSGRAIIFRTADLAVTEITLAANDVAFIRRDGRVLVSPAPGQGVFFGFEE